MKYLFVLSCFVAVVLTREFLPTRSNSQLVNSFTDRGLVSCTVCRETLETAIGWLESGVSVAEIINRLTTICVDLGIENERVCRGTLDMHVEYFVWILEAKNETSNPLTAVDICGLTLYPECEFDPAPYEWTLDLDSLGPKPTPELPQIPPQGSPTLKVIQFTDLHVDPNYTPGYNAECDEPMCCRFDQGIPENVSAAAGYWGDYRVCDSPIHSFQNMLADAAARHQDVAYVIYTGDMIDHASWDTNAQYNSEIITLVENEFLLNFPNVPVISIFGNHESHPSNVFWDPRKTEVPENLRNSWLYNLAASLWGTWLPPETQPDILAGGHFAVEVQAGLYVIGINTMWCYTANWWLMYDNVDPAGELLWLANKLLEIEQAGKKAHILAHHPTGRPECTHFWTSQYRRILDRFENTVLAQFHGHTHNDHFSIYYDLVDPSRPISVAFIAGSGTPYVDVNPNYRTYTVDANSFRVLDHETWYYNLTEANLGGALTLPNWQKLYSFNEAYGTTAVFPDQMDALVHLMVNDPTLQNQYFRYYVKDGDAAMEQGCDAACMQVLLCDIVTTVQNDTSKCNELFP